MQITSNDWNQLLINSMNKKYMQEIHNFIEKTYAQGTIYPPKNQIFSSLELCSYSNTKVVILGQDPYHGENQAHGLSFSVQDGVKTPRSLGNIYKELKFDLGIDIPTHGNLENWSKQGVLLLNTVLTVESGKANSHKKLIWEDFTDKIIELLNNKKSPIVFILWGNNAKLKLPLITNPDHLILSSVHPSPLSASRGFFGSKPFSKTNSFLNNHYENCIDWSL